MVASTIANANRDPKTRRNAFQPEDFMPRFEDAGSGVQGPGVGEDGDPLPSSPGTGGGEADEDEGRARAARLMEKVRRIHAALGGQGLGHG